MLGIDSPNDATHKVFAKILQTSIPPKKKLTFAPFFNNPPRKHENT